MTAPRPRRVEPTAPQLGLNSAGVPGGLGFDMDSPAVAAGIEWQPADAGPWASPIGAHLAVETARKAAS